MASIYLFISIANSLTHTCHVRVQTKCVDFWLIFPRDHSSNPRTQRNIALCTETRSHRYRVMLMSNCTSQLLFEKRRLISGTTYGSNIGDDIFEFLHKHKGVAFRPWRVWVIVWGGYVRHHCQVFCVWQNYKWTNDGESGGMTERLLFAGRLMSQQHASVPQGQICSDKCMCYHTEIEVQHHPVTVYWHQANQSQHWPYTARRLAG